MLVLMEEFIPIQIFIFYQISATEQSLSLLNST